MNWIESLSPWLRVFITFGSLMVCLGLWFVLYVYFACEEQVLGYTIFGNPIFYCAKHDHYWEIIGAWASSSHDITKEEAEQLLGMEL